MDLLVAENAIITRLEAQIKASDTTDFDAPVIESFPQEPESYFENLSSTGTILVRFNGAIPEIPLPNRESVIVQNIPIDWAIWIVMPNLIEHNGIYNWIEKVKDALTGYHLSDNTDVSGWDDAGPLYCTNIQFIEEDGGIWFYEMNFQHQLEESE